MKITFSQVSDGQEAVEDRIGASLVAGANVTLSYDDATGKTTINATAGGGSGSPGGADRQVQYNNAGAFAGADRVDIDASGNLRCDNSPTSTAPGADQITFTPQRIGAAGGRLLPRWRLEDGTFKTMQASVGRNSIMYGQAMGNTTTVIVPVGSSAFTALGTPTARSVATTNRLTRARRIGYVSAATAGGMAGLHGISGHHQFTVGAGGTPPVGGFLAIFRWGVSDAATVAGAHMFVGMFGQTPAPTATTSPAAFTQSVGIAQVNGSANLQIVYGGSAAQTPVDLGASFPAASTSALYELVLYARPDASNTIGYRVENITTCDTAEGLLTGTAGTAIPSATNFMNPRMYRSNNATALAVGMDIVSYYIESDI